MKCFTGAINFYVGMKPFISIFLKIYGLGLNVVFSLGQFWKFLSFNSTLPSLRIGFSCEIWTVNFFIVLAQRLCPTRISRRFCPIQALSKMRLWIRWIGFSFLRNFFSKMRKTCVDRLLGIQRLGPIVLFEAKINYIRIDNKSLSFNTLLSLGFQLKKIQTISKTAFIFRRSHYRSNFINRSYQSGLNFYCIFLRASYGWRIM